MDEDDNGKFRLERVMEHDIPDTLLVFHSLNLSVRGATLESDVYRPQILTSKVDPRTEKNEKYIMALDHKIVIQMKRKELTETFMVISN